MGQKSFWVPICLWLVVGFSGRAQAQQAARPPGQAPTDSDIYCAGFFAPQPIAPDLIVLSSEDGNLKNEYTERDILYLNKGRPAISAPGGQYLLVRPVKETNPQEVFPGQLQLLSQLGTLYAEVGRIQVQIVHEASATAEVLRTCEPVLAGDIAIPLTSRPAPPYRTDKVTDRFAPASGKAMGLIVAAKEFRYNIGEGNIVYLNLGNNQGAQVGSYLRIFRSSSAVSQEIFQARRNYLTEFRGVPTGHELTPDEQASLPRRVLGEILLLSVQENNSTGIITFSREEISPGDEAELE